MVKLLQKYAMWYLKILRRFLKTTDIDMILTAKEKNYILLSKGKRPFFIKNVIPAKAGI